MEPPRDPQGQGASEEKRGRGQAGTPNEDLDALADEADKESFPASDPPSRWSGPPN
ncbi:MAG TPA: hypothetical protein VEJ87_01920 [Acidimicrobiales bacterium]|nr:hypothetical protein [Acidimicrobiales bacterium]